ncbi:MAG: signal peptidase II [Candidatus Falkowbacteria bacterium]
MTNLISNLKIKNIAWLSAMAMFFLIDRYLKFLAITLWPSYPKKIISNFLTFNFVPNYHIAFSLPLGGIWLNILISIIILTILYYLKSAYKHLSKLEIISFSGIILGATSNLIDRLKYGYVIDYLDLKWFTVFNLSDALISLSALALLIYLIKNSKETAAK